VVKGLPVPVGLEISLMIFLRVFLAEAKKEPGTEDPKGLPGPIFDMI